MAQSVLKQKDNVIKQQFSTGTRTLVSEPTLAVRPEMAESY
jgi:hypothetical protein